MKKVKKPLLSIATLFMLMLSLLLGFAHAQENKQNLSKITFWQTQKKGANIFNEHIKSSDIRAAKRYKIAFIRLSFDKFPTAHRDFLLGDADNYSALAKDDLNVLKRTLDLFYQEKMPVVITMLSLPGSRWKQNNRNKDDLRIWTHKKYQTQAAQFWQDLAAVLKDHPAVVGYNILNEPHPERIFASKAVHINTVNQGKTQQMLYDLYGKIIHAIRQVDKNTPIILDSSAYADPQTFDQLAIQKDKNILYSFHM